VEAVVTQPLEVVKTSQQASRGGDARSWAQHVRARGPFAGLAPQLAQTTVKVGLRFAAYDGVRRAVGADALAGFVAGALEALVWIAPTERLKVLRIQHRETHPNLAASIRCVVAAQGVRGLWRGGTATVLRNSSVVGTRFVVYGETSRSLRAAGAVPADAVPAVAGLLAGALTTVLSQPLDVLKTVMNAADVGERAESNLDALRRVWRERGARGFTAGLGARVLKIGTGQAVIFVTYESMMRRLSP